MQFLDMYKHTKNMIHLWAVVVARLAERSLSIPEMRGLNPVIRVFLKNIFTVNCLEKAKIKKRQI